ncbi:MAG TPA: porin [Steroidobacteraceae bacterium]
MAIDPECSYAIRSLDAAFEIYILSIALRPLIQIGSEEVCNDKLGGRKVAVPALVLLGALAAASALAQQKTGPGITGDDSLTWNGITLYGVIDIGLQFDTHSAPFTPYRPAASGNIVRSNDYQSAIGPTPSNMGQSRIGLQGIEPLTEDLSAVFQVETFFNPQSGEIADSLKSLTANNGRAVTAQSIGVDGSSAGQAFQTAYVGLKSARFGSLTFGRQVTLLAEGTIKYDPNYNATAFGLLGASNTYSGGGSSEDNRLDSTAKYFASFSNLAHLAALYKFSGSNGAANSAVQANIGAEYSGFSVDGYYSKLNSAITASSLSSAQVAGLPTLGYSSSNALVGTISDNTTYSLMALYRVDPLRFFAGYMKIKYANPESPLKAGFTNIGGYVLAFVTNSAYNAEKTVQVYWSGVRYSVLPNLELAFAYYGYRQNAYGTGIQAGCSTSAHSTCSGSLEAFSFDADYHFNKHFDAYAGTMYSGVHDGAASGYLYSTNVNPTIGVRYKF